MLVKHSNIFYKPLWHLGKRRWIERLMNRLGVYLDSPWYCRSSPYKTWADVPKLEVPTDTSKTWQFCDKKP